MIEELDIRVRKKLYLPVGTIYLSISIYLAVASNRVFKVINFQHRAFKEQKRKTQNVRSSLFYSYFCSGGKMFCTFVMDEYMSDTKDENTLQLFWIY